MANTLGDVKAKVRMLLGDPQGQWLDDATLVPAIQQVYETQANYLAGSSSPFIVKLVTIPNVPAGTNSLIPDAQNAFAPLKDLLKPRLIRSKLAGTPSEQYCEMEEVDVLPNVPQGWPMRQGKWEWRAFRIWMTPFSDNVDLEIRGEFGPDALNDDKDELTMFPRMAHSTAYGAASLLAVTIGNQGWEVSYGRIAETTLADINAQLVRQMQGLTFRVGRIGGGGKNRGNRRFNGA